MSKEKSKEQELDITNLLQKLPPSFFLRLINKAKNQLKSDPTMQQVFKDYDVDINFIDFIPVTFGDLDVSATTNKGVITLNYKLLYDKDKECFCTDQILPYLLHEANHHLQQCYNDKPTKGSMDGDYLENPSEQEAFQNQIEYIANHEGEEEAEEYVEKLLDHHDVKNKKEKAKLEDVLLEKV